MSSKPKRPRRPSYADPSQVHLVPHGGALRAQTERATDAVVRPLDRLRAAREARELLDLVEGIAWGDARGSGYSWLELGEAAGMTRSGAQQRAAALAPRLQQARSPRP